MIARGDTPTPTLPRKRERGRSEFFALLPRSAASPCFPLPLAGEGGARVSARRVGARAANSRYRMDPPCGPIRNDNKIKRRIT